MKCVSPTDHITFHSRHLKIRLRNVGLRNLNRTQTIHIITRASQDIENDLLTISLSQPLQADLHYELKLYFKGILDENKFGYYRSPYLDKDEETKWLAVTYFKPNHARWAFPCFDEVIFKAKFTISLGRSIRFKSLSNMPLVKTEKM